MKKIVCFILTIIITILLILLAVSFCIKTVIMNTINTEIVSVEVASKLTATLKKYNVSNEDLKKIEMNVINSDNTYKITEKYTSAIMELLVNNKKVLPNTKEEVSALLNENKSYINNENIDLTQEQKEEIINTLSNNEGIDNIYKVVSHKVQEDISTNQIQYISLYNKLITNKFRIIILSIILLSTMLIGVLKSSTYKWMINISIASLLAGIFIMYALPIFIDFVINDMLQMVGNYKVNLSYLINFGYLYIGLFGLFILLYLVLSKIINNYQNSFNY